MTRPRTSSSRRVAAGLVFAWTVVTVTTPIASAAPDTVPPSTPSGVVATVGAGAAATNISFDAEAGGLAGISSSQRARVAPEAARSGTAGLRVESQNAPAFAQWRGSAVPAGSTHAAVRTWVRLNSRAAGQSVDLLTVANSSGVRNFDFFVTGDTQRFKWDIFQGNVDETSFRVNPGQWYLIEVLVDYSGTRHSATVRIDGVDQGTIVSVGEVVTVASVTIGTHAAKTHSQDYDDLAVTFDDAPLGWIVPEAGATRVTLTWLASSDNATGIAEYQIWRNGAWYDWVPGTTTSWVEELPVDGARYQIRAVDGASNRSGWSAPVTVTLIVPDTTPPPTPTNLLLVRNADGSVRLSWAPVIDTGGSGLREYAIYRNSRWYGWVPATITVFVDPAPPAGATYQVRAIDHALNVSPSSASVG